MQKIKFVVGILLLVLFVSISIFQGKQQKEENKKRDEEYNRAMADLKDSNKELEEKRENLYDFLESLEREYDFNYTDSKEDNKKISIELPPLPCEVSYISFGKIRTTTKITKIQYTYEENYDGTICLIFYFDGEIIYNVDDEPNPCRFDVAIYDEYDNILDRSEFIGSWLSEGDSFNDEEFLFYDLDLEKKKKYKIKLYNFN